MPNSENDSNNTLHFQIEQTPVSVSNGKQSCTQPSSSRFNQQQQQDSPMTSKKRSFLQAFQNHADTSSSSSSLTKHSKDLIMEDELLEEEYQIGYDPSMFSPSKLHKLNPKQAEMVRAQSSCSSCSSTSLSSVISEASMLSRASSVTPSPSPLVMDGTGVDKCQDNLVFVSAQPHSHDNCHDSHDSDIMAVEHHSSMTSSSSSSSLSSSSSSSSLATRCQSNNRKSKPEMDQEFDNQFENQFTSYRDFHSQDDDEDDDDEDQDELDDNQDDNQDRDGNGLISPLEGFEESMLSFPSLTAEGAHIFGQLENLDSMVSSIYSSMLSDRFATFDLATSGYENRLLAEVHSLLVFQWSPSQQMIADSIERVVSQEMFEDQDIYKRCYDWMLTQIAAERTAAMDRAISVVMENKNPDAQLMMHKVYQPFGIPLNATMLHHSALLLHLADNLVHNHNDSIIDIHDHNLLPHNHQQRITNATHFFNQFDDCKLELDANDSWQQFLIDQEQQQQ